jgi:poly[(R)-3-hydroxyalkanoate] polymerase subunit PhaE
MKTNNQFLDSIIETQTEAINSWVDSTKKIQTALVGGNIATEAQTIYKEWMDKQMGVFSGMQANFSKVDTNKPEEFFKNWYNQQLAEVKKMTDFNQGLFSTISNFGKSPADYMTNYNQSNLAWTNIYNTWISTLNTTYDTFSKNIPSALNKDAFKNIFEGNKVYLKLQEFWQPAFASFQNGNFSVDGFKKFIQPDAYKAITEQMFQSMYGQATLKDVFDASIKKIQDYFVNQHNLSKEYTSTFTNISNEFPQLVSGDFAKLTDMYKHAQNVFAKSFEPILKLTQAGKEKEAIEANIELLDKISEYSVKQAQLQQHLYATTQKAMEEAAKKAFEKMTPETLQQQSFTEFYNEWLKTNETLFTELFESSEYSKLKGEILSISMDVKKQFEKQYESVFAIYPIVFKSETEELYKTVYELKKQVKALETRIAAQGAASLSFDDEDRTTKTTVAKKK